MNGTSMRDLAVDLVVALDQLCSQIEGRTILRINYFVPALLSELICTRQSMPKVTRILSVNWKLH